MSDERSVDDEIRRLAGRPAARRVRADEATVADHLEHVQGGDVEFDDSSRRDDNPESEDE